MTQQDYTDHPITPPPELVQQWTSEWMRSEDSRNLIDGRDNFMAARAAQWGADQELEACCKELEYNFMPDSSSLRAARRPKPPSLKELALEALDAVDSFGNEGDRDTICRALEQLDD